MTEEIKSQLDYLKDEPKYLRKVIDELQQENKELKRRVNEQWKLLEQCGINSGGELRRAGYIINDFVQLSNKYRSALEEIQNAKKSYDLAVDNGASVDTLYKIGKIVNEVLE